MVLKECFYVGASLYRLCESDIFGVRASFGVDACRVFPQSALAIIFLIGVCVQYCGDQSLHLMLGRASSALWPSQPCGRYGEFCSPFVAIESLSVGFDKSLKCALYLQ